MSFRIVVVAVVVLLVAPAAWAVDGATVYKESCAKCHGETGKADTPAAKALKVPPLQDDAKVAKMTEQEVAERIKTNEKHPPTVKKLGDAEVEAAAAYAKKLAAE